MSKVYVVIKHINVDGFTDHYGEQAPDYSEIYAIYNNKKDANDAEDVLTGLAEIAAKRCNTDPEWYTVEEWEVFE